MERSVANSGKYIPAKFVNFAYICITEVKPTTFEAKAKGSPVRNTNTTTCIYKIRIFYKISLPKLSHFTNFKILLSAEVKDLVRIARINTYCVVGRIVN